MATIKLPVYLKITKDQFGVSRQWKVAGASSELPDAVATNVRYFHFELEVDDSLLQTAIETDLTIKIGAQPLDSAQVVEGLRQIKKDVKKI